MRACGLPREWRRTLAAKLEARRILHATLRTSAFERRGALTTEFHSLGILKSAALTTHVASLLLRARQYKETAHAWERDRLDRPSNRLRAVFSAGGTTAPPADGSCYGHGSFWSCVTSARFPGTPSCSVTVVAVFWKIFPSSTFPVPVLSGKKGLPSRPPMA